MARPARIPKRHRGLRILHAFVRLVLVAALVVLLTLIAVHELQGLTAAAVGGSHALATTPAQAVGTAVGG